ncbi:MAG: hypothetical protein AB7H90_22435 [Alphaproteobacteria bacterium]
MAWLRDRAWQQGIAILLALAGAVLIYFGARPAGELGGVALTGIVLFATGIALPLIVELLRMHREDTARSEDV